MNDNGHAVPPPSDGFRPRDLRFGVFLTPVHDVAGNQTLQLERDLELVELADRLGFDEAWYGEHLTVGVSPLGTPEMFLAAASQRTTRIRLGTAVSSLPLHHPYTLANRILDLDHVSRGRAMMGMGPGGSPQEGAMMGLDFAVARDRMAEAAEVIVPLLRGEVVSCETDWFTLRDAQLQSLPCNPDGIEFLVASALSLAGSTLAARLGLGILSPSIGPISLADNWASFEANSAANGHRANRSAWRIVGAVHLAETRERARAEARTRILPELIALNKAMLPKSDWQPWMDDADAAIEHWTTEGLTSGGVAAIGTPDEAVAAIRELIDVSGGFGCYVLHTHNAAPWDATKRSLELFAEYVIPEVRRTNERRKESARLYHERAAEFSSQRVKAAEEARKKFPSDRALTLQAEAASHDSPARLPAGETSETR